MMNNERNDTVSEVIDGRRGVYGDPTEMFARAAQIWSGITGHTINAVDVPLMLIGYKVLRAQHTPDYSDNSDDIEGYLDIFRELVGGDMVKARSVTEYLEKKNNPPLTEVERATLAAIEEENERVVPVDTYEHRVQRAGFEPRVCTWSPRMQGWYFENEGQRWLCSLPHP